MYLHGVFIMKRNVLPDWYPSKRHTSRIYLKDWIKILSEHNKRAQNLDLLDLINSNNISKISLANSFRRWRPLKVLDYLDLYFWSIETNTAMTGDFLAETLYPYSEATNLRGRLMNHTKPLALSLINSQTVDLLIFFEKNTPASKLLI